MSVYCAKTGRLIAGVKPVKIISKKRNVIYKDAESGREFTGWEIAEEIWVHPAVANDYVGVEPEVVGQVIREVQMTKPGAKYDTDEEYSPIEEY